MPHAVALRTFYSFFQEPAGSPLLTVEGESSAGPGRCQFERFLAQDEQKQSKYKKEMVAIQRLSNEI
jgi:hypothetical protein